MFIKRASSALKNSIAKTPRLFCMALSLLIALSFTAEAATKAPLQHHLVVTLDPANASAAISDRMLIPEPDAGRSRLTLTLHGHYDIETIDLPNGLESKVIPPKIDFHSSASEEKTILQIDKAGEANWPNPLEIHLKYSGPFHDPLKTQQEPSRTPDEVASKNEIFLSGASLFYPHLDTLNGEPDRIIYTLETFLPENWMAVSQGRLNVNELSENQRRVVWNSTRPAEEIFLIANQFKQFNDRWNEVELYAFLLEDDAALAKKYLDATKNYLKLFSAMLGDYPYQKFALIESDNPAGYGMPSFTLIGSNILRLPFILKSSYPHEILHNWWGNGVFPHPNSANWSEGLTTYLADHLLKEPEGLAQEYRFQELMKYDSYVNDDNEFPLSEFQFGGAPESQAIGYGKMLMMFHMLRNKMGDDKFLLALRSFYKSYQFKFARLEDLQSAFESVARKDYSSFFKQWTLQTGAPTFTLQSAEYRASDKILKLTLEQSGQSLYDLEIPVAIWTRSRKEPEIRLLHLNQERQSYSIRLDSPPDNVWVDPYTDIFRRLQASEIPASLSQSLGAEHQTALLASDLADGESQESYRALAKRFTHSIQETADGDALEPGSLWVFGRKNRLAKEFTSALQRYGVQFNAEGIDYEGKTYNWADHSFVFTLNRHDGLPGSMTWVVTENSENLLARKLPHYGKYGFLAFEGPASKNRLKIVWPRNTETLEKQFVAGTYAPPAPAPLFTLPSDQP
ncbi:MAG: hypothetical protein G3M78_13965 [Candidatus Nitrohelix vancouverensis]|uniref:Peptidase M1 membrane alanine aminopeptidase domain-containing protein n=1 Tax=Candidatus Nitrohelix vancouverensis TaxID=2705534 RepID=A0A7T0C4W1_9BACT|nr:MAG: hypothetical protein G3M78_13965 [Candidatus Nitrohelix vancouverensis]